MAQLDRRNFVGTLAVLPASYAVARADWRAQLGNLFIETDDRELLHALAATILPEELGAARTREFAERFERWVSNFRPGAEQNHGYGTGELEQAPADPWPRWRQQLQTLEAESQKQYSNGFSALPAERRTTLVATQLEAVRADRIPAPLGANHVALALLGWFYNTPEATDLCYRAAIGKENCRALNEAPNKPRSL
jgi:gluconate 2-dehydrogenase subunit 3-like protein